MKKWEIVSAATLSLGLLATMRWELLLPHLSVELSSVVALLIFLGLVLEQLSMKKTMRPLQQRFLWQEGLTSGVLLSLVLVPQLYLASPRLWLSEVSAQAAAQLLPKSWQQLLGDHHSMAWISWQHDWQPLLFALFYQLCLLRILLSTFRSYQCLRPVLYCGLYVAGLSGLVILSRLSGLGEYWWRQLAHSSYESLDIQSNPADFGAGVQNSLNSEFRKHFVGTLSRPLGILLLPLFSLTNCAAALFWLRQQRALQTEWQRNQRLNRSASDLAQSNIHVLDRALLHSSEIRQRERLEVAREIHDVLGFTLSAGLMNAEVLLQELQDDPKLEAQLLRKLETLLRGQQEQIREAIGQVRATVSKLRSAGEHQRFVGDWELLMDIFGETTRILVIRNIPASFAQLKNPAIGKLIYRLIQESLTNALRHGQASIVDVSMLQEEKLILLRISDNGIGCKLLQVGNGLSGMMERLELLGGKLTWRTGVGKGFDLGVEIPYCANDFLPGSKAI